VQNGFDVLLVSSNTMCFPDQQRCQVISQFGSKLTWYGQQERNAFISQIYLSQTHVHALKDVADTCTELDMLCSTCACTCAIVSAGLGLMLLSHADFS